MGSNAVVVVPVSLPLLPVVDPIVDNAMVSTLSRLVVGDIRKPSLSIHDTGEDILDKAVDKC